MKTKLLLSGMAAAVLVACGGSDDNTTATTPPPAAVTSISGTAAVGAALADATVEAKCANGSGTAKTGADGRFTLSIAGATRPCVLSVTTPDGAVLHSVVEPGESLTATANITPLTELITAALANGNTADFFARFDGAAQGRITPANIGSAADSVQLVLSGLVDLTGFDPIKGTLVAANGSQGGNDLDKKLDELGEILKRARTTIAELSNAVGANAGPTAIATVLNPASASCAGLRSGTYAFVLPGATPGAALPTFTVNAETLEVTEPLLASAQSGPSRVMAPLVLEPVQGSECEFDFMGSRLLVAGSGMGLLVSQLAPDTYVPMPIVPIQPIPLAEFAGNWIAVGFEADDVASQPQLSRIMMTIGADGKFTAGADCDAAGSCTAWTPSELPALVAGTNGDGTYRIVDSEGETIAVAFKGTDGRVSMYMVHDAGLLVATQQKPLALPTLGATRSYWDMTMGIGDPGSPTISTLESFSTKVIEVNAQQGTYSRERNDGRLDQWTINKPADGLRYRALSAAAAESTSMDLGNTGMTVAVGRNPSMQFMSFSVLRQ